MSVEPWMTTMYCLRCDCRYDKVEEKLWCGHEALGHKWRTDMFRGLIDLIEEAGAVAYIHEPDCGMWVVAGRCDKECGRRAYEAARATPDRSVDR